MNLEIGKTYNLIVGATKRMILKSTEENKIVEAFSFYNIEVYSFSIILNEQSGKLRFEFDPESDSWKLIAIEK